MRALVPVLCSALLALLCQGAPARAQSPVPLGVSYLGVHTRSNSNVLEATNLYEGVTVTRVGENSPAAAVGVKPGDVLLQANGAVIAHPSELDALVAALPVGSEVKLRLERDERVIEVATRTVALVAPLESDESPAESGEGEAVVVAPTSWIERRHVGVEFGQPSEERARELGLNPSQGVEVRRMAQASPMRAAGIPLGAVLVVVDGKPILDPGQLIEFLDKLTTEQSLMWTVRDGPGRDREVEVPTYKPEWRLQRCAVPLLFNVERTRDKSDYSFLLGLVRVERYDAGTRVRLLYFFDLKTGTWDELLEVEGS